MCFWFSVFQLLLVFHPQSSYEFVRKKTEWVWNRHGALGRYCAHHCLLKWSSSSRNQRLFLLSLLRVVFLSPTIERLLWSLSMHFLSSFLFLSLFSSWSENTPVLHKKKRIKCLFFNLSVFLHARILWIFKCRAVTFFLQSPDTGVLMFI